MLSYCSFFRLRQRLLELCVLVVEETVFLMVKMVVNNSKNN